jgi:hypothetical protein
MAENKLYNFNLPSPYQSELSKIADQQRMAQMLQAQSQQPTERFSYKGIEARTPATAGLAKLLQGLAGGYFQNEARNQEKALGERYRQEGMDDITRFAEMASRPAVAATPGSEAFMPMGADYDDRGGAPAFKLDEQGMVPAADPVAARMRGQIDPSMIGQFKTPEMQRMALAQMLKQSELPAAFNLGAEETRFQQPVGGGAPVVVARGAAKPLPSPFAQINLEKFTPASVQAAMNPDGTVDRTKLVAIPERATGDLAVYNLYVEQQKAAGKVPMGIDQFMAEQKRAGRTPPAITYGSPVAATDAAGNPVFLQPGRTGNAPSVIQGFTPPVEKLRPIPATVNTAILGNEKANNQLDRAIALLSGKDLPGMTGDASATGFKGVLPNAILNRVDPQGVAARAEIADIGSLILHDRSGAAVTASESPRLMPFIPTTTDDNDTVLKKLGRLKLELANETAAMKDIYSKEQGYKESPVLNKPSVAQKITTIAEIADVAVKTGKTVDQVTRDAISKGYKVNP